MMSGGMMFSKGDIVIVKFPFSDLINAKKRPMIVLAERGNDILGCAVTSNPASEGVPISSFAEGNLPFESKIKYWQIITFEKGVIIKKVAKISTKTHKELLVKINELIKL
jgi:mRNA interferase MazF